MSFVRELLVVMVGVEQCEWGTVSHVTVSVVWKGNGKGVTRNGFCGLVCHAPPLADRLVLP